VVTCYAADRAAKVNGKGFYNRPSPDVKLNDERLVFPEREDIGKRRRLFLVLQLLQRCAKGFSVASIATETMRDIPPYVVVVYAIRIRGDLRKVVRRNFDANDW
jgi:hypothetical protein